MSSLKIVKVGLNYLDNVLRAEYDISEMQTLTDLRRRITQDFAECLGTENFIFVYLYDNNGKQIKTWTDISDEYFDCHQTESYLVVKRLLLPTDLSIFQLTKFFLNYHPQIEKIPYLTEELIRYSQLGKLILENQAGKIHQIARSIEESANDFLFVCLPRGCGKSQLAFALPRNIYTVFYIPLESDPKRQFVYRVNERFILDFKLFLENDTRAYDVSDSFDFKSNICGFFHAVLQLIRAHNIPVDNFPEAMSRFSITEQRMTEFSVPIQPVDYKTLSVFKEQVETHLNTKFIIFFDEFSPDVLSHKKLAFLRRISQNAVFRVVVASTSSTAANMTTKEAQTVHSRGEPSKYWVTILRSLPKFQFTIMPVSPSHSMNIFSHQKLLNSSRPLFSSELLYILNEVADHRTTSLRNDADILDLFRECRVKHFYKKPGLSMQRGVKGSLLALLSAGYVYTGMTTEEIKFYASLSTQSWAFLANDPLAGRPDKKSKNTEILRFDDCDNLIRLKRVKDISQRLDDNLEIEVQGTYQTWRSSPFFKNCADEFLLYLFLAGSVQKPGLYLQNRRISVTSLVKKSSYESKRLVFQNLLVFKRDGTEWEGSCCAAFWVACNSGSVAGTPLHEVISKIVSELYSGTDFIEFHFDETCKKFSHLLNAIVPFISPYNSPWPQEVSQLIGTRFGYARRPKDPEGIDGIILGGELKIQLEMKSRGSSVDIMKALQRICIDTQIAFIFCNDRLVNPFKSLDGWRELTRHYLTKVPKEFKKKLDDVLLLVVAVDHQTQLVKLHQFGPNSIPEEEFIKEQSAKTITERTLVILFSSEEINDVNFQRQYIADGK